MECCLPMRVLRERKHQLVLMPAVSSCSQQACRERCICQNRVPLDRLNKGMLLWSCHPGLVIGEQAHNRPFPLAQLFPWCGQTSLFFLFSPQSDWSSSCGCAVRVVLCPDNSRPLPKPLLQGECSKILVFEWAGNIFLTIACSYYGSNTHKMY